MNICDICECCDLMKINLSESAKRQIIFQACIDAKKKFVPEAIVNWTDGNYKVEVYYCCSQLRSTEKIGFFRKKTITQDHVLEIHCVEVEIFRKFGDIQWGEIRVKSLNREFDNLAEEIALTIEQYTPVILIVNDPSKVGSLTNPSRR